MAQVGWVWCLPHSRRQRRLPAPLPRTPEPGPAEQAAPGGVQGSGGRFVPAARRACPSPATPALLPAHLPASRPARSTAPRTLPARPCCSVCAARSSARPGRAVGALQGEGRRNAAAGHSFSAAQHHRRGEQSPKWAALRLLPCWCWQLGLHLRMPSQRGACRRLRTRPLLWGSAGGPPTPHTSLPTAWCPPCMQLRPKECTKPRGEWETVPVGATFDYYYCP